MAKALFLLIPIKLNWSESIKKVTARLDLSLSGVSKALALLFRYVKRGYSPVKENFHL